MGIRRRVATAAAAAALAGSSLFAVAGTADAGVAATTHPGVHSTHRLVPRPHLSYYGVVGIPRGHRLAVYSAPGTRHRIVGFLRAGEVTVGDGHRKLGYDRVRAADGRFGWASAAHLQLVKRAR